MQRLTRISIAIFLSLAVAIPCSAEEQEAAVERSSLQTIDYLAIVGYMAIIMVVGVYFARREKTTEDYFLAGRRIPWWAATLSIFSTYLSAITFMSIPAKAFATDWLTVLVNIGIILAAPVTVFCFLPFFRRLNVTTIYEYLELRFSPALRVYGSLAFLAYQVAKMGIFLVLPALALTTVTGLDVYWCIAVMGLLCIVYTVLGGIEAVVWTDVLQSVVLIGGALLCIGMVFSVENFDFERMIDVAITEEKNKFSVGHPGTGAFWYFLVGGFFIQMVPFTSDQAVAQRFLTTPDEKSAARSVWAHAAMVIPASLLFFGLGTALYVFYTNDHGPLPDAGQDDIIVPWFIVKELPAGLAGLVIAGLFAATMSSVDSGMHSIATTLTNDVYSKLPRLRSGVNRILSIVGLLRRDTADEKKLAVARTITVLAGLCGILSAVFLTFTGLDRGSLWILLLKVVIPIASPLTGVFLLGVLTRRAHSWGTAIGVFASMVTLVVLQNIENNPIPGILTAAVGVLTCVLVGYLASLAIPGPSRSLANLTLRTAVDEEETGKEEVAHE
jgi:SSS family transporter